MKSIYFPALIAGLIFFSCNSKNNSPADVTTNSLKAEIMQEPVNKEPESFADSIGTPQQTGGQADKKQTPSQQKAASPDWDKKIIKTASLNAEVKDFNGFYSSLREKVKNIGGYIAQEEQTQSDYKMENTMVIKVPVDKFDDAIVQLSTDAVKINEKKISSQDVTGEIIDTKSRMEAKKQVRQRYMDFLSQAKNMNDVLNVQSEINSVQEEIESATGRIQYMNHASVFSTINLTYYQVLNATAKEPENPSVATKLSSSFKSGWSWVVGLSIGLVSIWPLFFLAAIIFIFYKRAITVKNKK